MRFTFACALVALLFAVPVVADEKTKSFSVTFGKGQLGKLPPEFEATQTGKRKGSGWKAVADKTAKSGYALAQTAEGPESLFNLCVVGNLKVADLEASVKVKAVAGKLDQGGGLVWRYKDANNYYVCRFNPLESN